MQMFPTTLQTLPKLSLDTNIYNSSVFATGYVGADCSIDEKDPPVLTGIVRSGICDIQQRPCATISVFGYGLISSKAMRCRFSVCCKLSLVISLIVALCLKCLFSNVLHQT